MARDDAPTPDLAEGDTGWVEDPRIAIARRELSSLTSEKTIVLALLIQLFIAAFSSFLVVGLTSLYDPGAVEGGQIEVGITGEAREALVQAADQQPGVSPVRFESETNAQAAFGEGAIAAVLAADTVSTEDGDRISVTATAPAENLRTTMIVVQLRRMLTELERIERVDRAPHLEFVPLEVPERIEASPYFGFTYTVLIPLLLFLPPFISGSVAVDAITEEIERGTLELLRVAPVSLVDVVDGKAAAMILLAPLQAGLWLLLLSLNGIAISHVLVLLAFVTAVATVVVVLGTLLGFLTARRRQAQLLYSILVIALFGAAVVLPEHPATTVAKLAVASPTATTYAHVAGFVAAAVALLVLTRRFAAGLDSETF